MAAATDKPAAAAGSEERDRREGRIRRYASRVTIAIILLCNTILLAGIWGSGVDLDRLIRTPDLFDPTRDVCVRYGWHKVAGVDKPVRLCAEWINLADPSGKTHRFQRGTSVVQGADGRLYFDHGPQVDHRIVLLGGLFLVTVTLGMMLNRYLIRRYRSRLEREGGDSPSGS